MQKRYLQLAKAVGSLKRCQAAQTDNPEWIEKHSNAIAELCEALPSGSGFDNGTEINLDESTGDKLVFCTSFHHMDEGGCYDGWTEHRVILTPSFELSFHMRITGPDRNGIKDMIGDTFSCVLDEELPDWTAGYPMPEAKAV
jgi:hypothetical protein